jgi:electron transport complex protein RnfG
MKGTGKIGGILKLGLVLTLYAAAACVGLAFVYAGTEKIIAQRQQADMETALKELFPQLDSFTDITGAIESPDPVIIFGSQYEIRRGDELIGIALQASGPSYGGLITALVGVEKRGTIGGVKILEHKDTPGLGAHAAESNYFIDQARTTTFYGQFTGKSLSDPFEVKDDVAAITAATVTSRAVSRVVKTAGTAALGRLGGSQ